VTTTLFAPPAAAPADNQWLFWSRNPEQFYRHLDIAVSFKHGQYLTADARVAEFLLGIENDSHGREVKCLMHPRPPADAAPETPVPVPAARQLAGSTRNTRRRRKD